MYAFSTFLNAIPSVVPRHQLFQLGVIGTVLGAVGVIWWVYGERIRTRLEERLLAGLPWSTALIVALLLGVYLFVQGGLLHWYDPVTIPFHSWSYAYPLGMVVAPFAHLGPGHLLGNLFATLLLAPIAEYAWGHFPSEADDTGAWWHCPRVRAGLLFPAGTIVAGLVTSLLGWGPIIGFSGVVYAFAGFALIYYPFATVVAVTADNALQTVYRAVQNPIVVREAHPAFVDPWWAQIAVQGHTLGLFIGVFAGVLLARRGETAPAPPLRLFIAGFLLAMSLSLWDIWWYRGGVTYVLYRGAGVMAVIALAAVITGGVHGHTLSINTGRTLRLGRASFGLLLLPIVVMGAIAVPLNLTMVDSPTVTKATDDNTIQMRGYSVTYAETVVSQKVAVVNVSIAGETTRVQTSGVIVVNDRREIWTTAVAAQRLAFTGRAAVTVGGIGWRETVAVKRRGWTVTGGETAYLVWLHHAGRWQRAFASDPATARPVLAGKNISVVPIENRFALRVTRQTRSLGTAPLPRVNQTIRIAGIQFRRVNDRIIAQVNRTRITVATKETYH